MTKLPLSTDNDTYVGVNEAARLVGKHRISMGRLIAKSGIPTYKDPLDGRRTLIAITDLEKILTIQPATK